MRHVNRWRCLARAVVLAVLAIPGIGSATGQTLPLRLHAAGSLSVALAEVARSFKISAVGVPVATVFGPSGLLRERIERGETTDVFAPAAFEHAERLERAGRTQGSAIVFVRNRLCLLARPGIALSDRLVLDLLLDPDLKLGTSTPNADPSGDYAWALFRRAEILKPGSFTALSAKALKLVGGPSSAEPPAGLSSVSWHLRDGRADIFLSYCTSGARAQAELPGTTIRDLPEPLAIGADYGLAVLSKKIEASRFALYVMSPAGQAILARHGFMSVTARAPEK